MGELTRDPQANAVTRECWDRERATLPRVGDAATAATARSSGATPRADVARMRGILISIKPEYATRIASGHKQVEFRRRASSALAGTWALVYESQPTCAVVMRVRFGAAACATPKELWATYRDVAGVGRRAFDAYMRGAARAWALEIERVEVLDLPRDLAWLRSRGVTIPVSYAMIKDDARWARNLLASSRARNAA